MSISRNAIYRKNLLKLGYKNTHITPLISQATVFKDIPKARGYAVQFDFRQAVMICVGCELFQLGLPFRHVDLALENLSKIHIVPDDTLDLNLTGKGDDEILKIVSEIADRYEYLILRPGGKVDSGEFISKKRVAPVVVEVFRRRENPITHFSNSAAGMVSFVCIGLGEVIRRVTWLFSGRL